MTTLKKRSDHRTDGFTLLEVMVAMAILGVGLVTVIQLYSGTLRTVEMAEYYTQAIHLAKLKLGEAELIPAVTEGKWNGEFEADELLKSASQLDLEEFPLFRWELRVEPYEPPEDLIPKPDEGEAQPVVENPIRMYKLVSVIFWGTENRPHHLELSTLRTTFKLPAEEES